MIEIRRRSFLFGLGATIAIASAKLPEFVTKVPILPDRWNGSRAYWQLEFDKCKNRPDYRWSDVKIFVNDSQYFNVGCAPFASFRWGASTDAQRWIVTDNDFLRILVENECRDVSMNLYFTEENGKSWLEKYLFDENGAQLQTEYIRMQA